MTFKNTLLAVLLTVTQFAMAKGAAPTAAPDVDPEFRTIPYTTRIITIPVKLGIFTNIELSEGETDIVYEMGDTDAWTIKRKGNLFAMKPKAFQPDTNLHLWSIHSNRRYWFKLVSAKPADVVPWQIRFTYPPEPLPAASAPKPPTPEELAEKARELIEKERNAVESHLAVPEDRTPQIEKRINGDYGIIGPLELTPTSTYDNGEETVLTFAPNNPMPEIFVKEADGTESRVEKHVENDLLIVHRVARKFVLRRGEQAACLINGSFTPTGPNNRTKTISNDVIREIKEPQ